MATEFSRKKSFVTDLYWQCRPVRREQQTPRVPGILEEPLGCINPYLWAPTNKVPSQATCCSLENPITHRRRDTWEHSTGKSVSLGSYQRQDIEFSRHLLDSFCLSFIHSGWFSLSHLYSSFPLIRLCLSSASSITLVFVLSSCLVLPTLSSHRPPLSGCVSAHFKSPSSSHSPPAPLLSPRERNIIHFPPSLDGWAASICGFKGDCYAWSLNACPMLKLRKI